MEEKIIKILGGILECEVNANTSQENTVEWDSIKQLMLVVELESQFAVMFEPEEMERMKSVTDIVNVIKNK